MTLLSSLVGNYVFYWYHGRPRPRTKKFSPELPSAPAHPVGGTSLGDAAPAGDALCDGVSSKLLGLVAKPLGSALPSGLIWAQKSSAAKGQRARAPRTHTHVGPQSAGGSAHTPTCQKVI